MTQFTTSDEGKTLVTTTGDVLGTIAVVVDGTAYVRPLDALCRRAPIPVHPQPSLYTVNEAVVTAVTDDSVLVDTDEVEQPDSGQIPIQ